MKCRECKESIQLLSELSPSERERVNAHMQSCNDCRQFFEETQQYSMLIQKAATLKPEPAHPTASVNAIMNRISAEKQSSANQHWSFDDFITLLWTRYTLAGISVCLVVFFLTEMMQSPGGTQIQLNMNRPNSFEVVLDSKSIRENFKRHDEERPTLMELCVVFNTGKIDVNCIKQKVKSQNFN